MNKYFKPLDWEINDYLSYINEPSSIDLSPYLQYIVPEDAVSEDKSSVAEPSPTVPILTPKAELPKSEPISIPKKDPRGESKITYIRRELNPQEFVSDFTRRYIHKGVNPEVAKIIAVQNLLESRSKDTKYYSQLADQYHNYGGVKWFGSLSDPSKYVTFDSEEEEDGVRSTKSSEFRVFKDRDEYVDYVIDWLKRGYDLRLDRSYTAEEYLSSLMGNNRSGRKWATASDYADTIRNMARSFKHGGILKAQHGVLLDSYADPKHYYDYSNGEYDEETGHWYSRNPDTGLELKHPNHPTHKIGQYYDKKEGLKRFRNKYNGRYYTLEDWNSGRFIPGMEEVDYDLIPNPFDDRIGRYMDGHTKEDEYDRWIGYSDIIKRASEEFGVPENIMIHLGSTESHFNPESYNNSTGASGIYQITPESLQWFKDKGHWREDYSDVENNIRAGAFLLRYFKNRYKDWDKALMGYKGIDPSIINNPNHPEYNSRRIKNKIDYLLNYL